MRAADHEVRTTTLRKLTVRLVLSLFTLSLFTSTVPRAALADSNLAPPPLVMPTSPPLTNGNSASVDKDFDYLLESKAASLSFKEADKEGRACFQDLERVKRMVREDHSRLLEDDRAKRSWLASFGECRDPALDYVNQPWYSVNVGEWLGFPSAVDHPKLRVLSIAWLRRGAQLSYAARNPLATYDACHYLYILYRPGQFRCYAQTVAWAKHMLDRIAIAQRQRVSDYSNSGDSTPSEQELIEMNDDSMRRQQDQQQQDLNYAGEQLIQQQQESNP